MADIEDPANVQARMPERKGKQRIAGLSTHRIMRTLGVTVPAAVAVTHDAKVVTLFHVDADEVGVGIGVTLIEHGNAVYLRAPNGGIRGTFHCSCGSVSGSCDIKTGIDTLGNPGVQCKGRGCSKGCKIDVQVPGAQLSPLIMRSAGVDIPPGVDMLGDATTGPMLITADRLVLDPTAGSSWAPAANNHVELIRSGVVIADFECGCKTGGGGCNLVVDRNMLLCQRNACANCKLEVEIPGLQVASR